MPYIPGLNAKFYSILDKLAITLAGCLINIANNFYLFRACSKFSLSDAQLRKKGAKKRPMHSNRCVCEHKKFLINFEQATNVSPLKLPSAARATTDERGHTMRAMARSQQRGGFKGEGYTETC
ncbi:hypothetical protein [Candidatus Regiella insecticola]|uniref:Glycoside hydrolase family 16 n=1 Tax=Candidatus Regiella insecticola TaxID=138073 RepID=A0A6L2ZQI7_9ENTR|nr:hypothetical protein [Candidatus Regiella insecticola]GFN46690.1 glycoside hydrolase family 16 [Candidatus Regiella insecticola]